MLRVGFFAAGCEDREVFEDVVLRMAADPGSFCTEKLLALGSGVTRDIRIERERKVTKGMSFTGCR